MSPSVVAVAPRAILWLPENSLEFPGHSTRQSCCSSPWVAIGGSSPSLCTLLQRGTFSLDRGAVGTHELTQASLQSPQSRAAPQERFWGARSGVHTATQLRPTPVGSNPKGAELWAAPKPNQRIPHVGNAPISGLASCAAACGPWLSPHAPHATLPVLALPQMSPPELPPRETPSDVGAKAINCTQPSLELEIHQLAFNS